MTMLDGLLPPTANLQNPEYELEIILVPNESRQRSVDHALKLSLGFGGHLVAAAVSRWQ